MSKFFSLAYLTLPNTHPVDQIEIAAQCGYEGVGLRTISQHLPGEPDYALANGRMFQMVRAALERTGVRLMDIELAWGPSWGRNTLSPACGVRTGTSPGCSSRRCAIWRTNTA